MNDRKKRLDNSKALNRTLFHIMESNSTSASFTVEHRGCRLAGDVRGNGAPVLFILFGIPTLVVSAAHDRIARPEFGRALAAGVPGARYVELENAAHGIPIERPAQINKLLLEHFDQSEMTCIAPSRYENAKRAILLGSDFTGLT